MVIHFFYNYLFKQSIKNGKIKNEKIIKYKWKIKN